MCGQQEAGLDIILRGRQLVHQLGIVQAGLEGRGTEEGADIERCGLIRCIDPSSVTGGEDGAGDTARPVGLKVRHHALLKLLEGRNTVFAVATPRRSFLVETCVTTYDLTRSSTKIVLVLFVNVLDTDS